MGGGGDREWDVDLPPIEPVIVSSVRVRGGGGRREASGSDGILRADVCGDVPHQPTQDQARPFPFSPLPPYHPLFSPLSLSLDLFSSEFSLSLFPLSAPLPLSHLDVRARLPPSEGVRRPSLLFLPLLLSPLALSLLCFLLLLLFPLPFAVGWV